MAFIRFLIDENFPRQIAVFLRGRGHEVTTVGETIPKSMPDAYLVAAAQQWGYVVITFDRDFRGLIRQVPRGSRRHVERRAGRIVLTCRETDALARIEELIEVIEFHYEFAQQRQQRLIIQISLTSFTVVG